MSLKNCSVFLIVLGIFISGNAMAEEQAPEVHNRMLSADANNDGKISFDEFKASHEKKLEAHFKRIDTNGDGEIDESERKAMHEKMHQMREKRMKNRDMMKSEPEPAK